MLVVPPFEPDGLLPPGDYEVSFEELHQSILKLGPAKPEERSSWDAPWRKKLIDNLEILARQLWGVGIREIFADGSFTEDKDHPNDIDGYFVCDLNSLKTGELARRLNLLDPFKVWTWDPASRKLTAAIRRSNCRCGAVTVWNFTRMCPAWALAVVSMTNTDTNWSFLQHLGSPDGTANLEGL